MWHLHVLELLPVVAPPLLGGPGADGGGQRGEAAVHPVLGERAAGQPGGRAAPLAAQQTQHLPRTDWSETVTLAVAG